MQDPNEALLGHMRRLIRALQKEGSDDQAAALSKLLDSKRSTPELAPSRVVLSLATLSGETLTPSVSPPVDKETGASLAEIVRVSPENIPEPLFNTDVSSGIDALIEEWRHVDLLQKEGINPALTTMLFGEPGTGKTMLAYYIAGQLGLPLIIARLDGLISSFLGTTARNISNLFSFANRYKCVLLLDEFDAVAKLRNDPHELGEVKRVVNTLLQCIDSRAKVGFTIAITNHESLLDPAVWRRFDIRIHIPKPDLQARINITRASFGAFLDDDLYIRFIAWATDGQSGSDIEKLSDFVKRQKVLSKDAFSVYNSVRNYINLSASDEETINRSYILGEQDQLAVILTTDRTITFSQENLAQLFDTTQSTISRMLKKKNSSFVRANSGK